MTPTTKDLLADAHKHHQAQRFAEAEGFYRRAVQIEPKHIGAWQSLDKKRGRS